MIKGLSGLFASWFMMIWSPQHSSPIMNVLQWLWFLTPRNPIPLIKLDLKTKSYKIKLHKKNPSSPKHPIWQLHVYWTPQETNISRKNDLNACNSSKGDTLQVSIHVYVLWTPSRTLSAMWNWQELWSAQRITNLGKTSHFLKKKVIL